MDQKLKYFKKFKLATLTNSVLPTPGFYKLISISNLCLFQIYQLKPLSVFFVFPTIRIEKKSCTKQFSKVSVTNETTTIAILLIDVYDFASRWIEDCAWIAQTSLKLDEKRHISESAYDRQKWIASKQSGIKGERMCVGRCVHTYAHTRRDEGLISLREAGWRGRNNGPRVRPVNKKGNRSERDRGWGHQVRAREGSRQSSGWVSARPVINRAYLHEHTSYPTKPANTHVAIILPKKAEVAFI